VDDGRSRAAARPGRAAGTHGVPARFWWLRGARTAPLRTGLAETFAGRPVEILAPSYGCIVVGADAVAAHVRALDGALEAAA
jgi:hypothetical protein